MPYEVKPGEIAIVMKPVVDTDGDWTGDIHTGLIFGSEKHIEAMRIELDMALTMASTARFLDDNPEFIELYDEYKHEALQEMFPEQYEQTLQELEEEEGYTQEDNVIRLNKWTKTQGNA